jgi:type VI secretion system secreted protein Hcp
MAFDAFLNIDGIKGESQDDKHKDWIEVSSFSWGLSQPDGAPTGAGAKAKVQDISFTKSIDAASPQLMLSCASGQHIKKAVLTCRTAGTQEDFLKITFQNILISGFVQGGHAASDQEPTPTEQVSFNFKQIQMSFSENNPDGTPGTPVVTDATLDTSG